MVASAVLKPDLSEPILTLDGVSIGLVIGGHTKRLVEDISLTLHRNEILCLVGESGSGKTLTARAPIALYSSQALSVTGGRILYDGEELTRLTKGRMRSIRGAKIAMIFQEPMTALNPLMRVGEQVEEIMIAHGRGSQGERRKRVLELFEEVRLPNPEKALDAFPHQLSGGQRQRVMIAMALALDPDVLLADEPTTALDVTTQKQILSLIKSLQARHGTGILFITHDFGVVSEIADRVIVMQHGKLIEQGACDQVLKAPTHAYTRHLIAAIPHAHGAGKERPSGPSILEASNIRKTYVSQGTFSNKSIEKHVLFDVSTEVRQGETFGIVGESGSGKTTLGRILAGLLPHDAGQVLFCGKEIGTSNAERREFRKKVQIIFQDPYGSLNPRRRACELIAAGPVAMGASRDEGRNIATRMLDMVGLPPEAIDRWPHEFSGGQRQRIAIARALAMKPELIIADEATSALDVSVQAQVLELLKDLKKQLGLTLVLITHDLRLAAGICEGVAVMKDGRIVEQGSIASVFGNPEHAYTRELLSAVPGRDRPLRSTIQRQDD
ncbi:ABC transporter ATP-binding protein [Arvimicrobium flavum]|uniref:ABC transporter ATP-binding protein n=1 Tax=Arvimicrobium flavum TaxID=3393320 RepID=UPI00237B4D81|nr:ABC transporter ATP-binding protein [Mesorhizobium shangrilense]